MRYPTVKEITVAGLTTLALAGCKTRPVVDVEKERRLRPIAADSRLVDLDNYRPLRGRDERYLTDGDLHVESVAKEKEKSVGVNTASYRVIVTGILKRRDQLGVEYSEAVDDEIREGEKIKNPFVEAEDHGYGHVVKFVLDFGTGTDGKGTRDKYFTELRNSGVFWRFKPTSSVGGTRGSAYIRYTGSTPPILRRTSHKSQQGYRVLIESDPNCDGDITHIQVPDYRLLVPVEREKAAVREEPDPSKAPKAPADATDPFDGVTRVSPTRIKSFQQRFNKRPSKLNPAIGHRRKA